MFVDTHCHINIMIKEDFDRLLTEEEVEKARLVVEESVANEVTAIINVGTSLVESLNCVRLAQQYAPVYATIGIHPNDGTSNWKTEFAQLKLLLDEKEKNKIVGIGECGIDLYRPGYNLSLQEDLFKAHIELAIERQLCLVIHSRNASDETFAVVEQYRKELKYVILHCFSYGLSVAQQAAAWGWYLGIDAPVTYPKNQVLRDVVQAVSLGNMVLETDSPFLPLQSMRGKPNHPRHVADIATHIATVRNESVALVAKTTTDNAKKIFRLV